jgi:hypothetical protein
MKEDPRCQECIKKNIFSGVVASDDAVRRGETLGDVSGISLDAHSCVGYKLLLKMGWREGSGLGKVREGLVQPAAVTLQHNERRCGLGGAAVMPQLRLDSMRDAEKALRRLLIDADPSVESRDFVGLTARERLHMHSAAEQLGLVSRSFGNSKKRFLRVSKRQLTSSATAVQTTDAAAGMNHGGGGGQPLTCVSGLRQQAESAAELVASRAAAGSERLGLGCYPADVGLPATSQPSSTTAADISLHIQHFTRAVRNANPTCFHTADILHPISYRHLLQLTSCILRPTGALLKPARCVRQLRGVAARVRLSQLGGGRRGSHGLCQPLCAAP